MAQNIVIYRDEGVGEFGLQCLAEFFRDHDVWFCTAESVIDGRVLDMADLFVMPGGADLPYCKKLNGAGNENLRAYVEEGGLYLGICAGAYYACRAIEYHKGRADEICQKRELSLIDGTAVGSLPELAPFYDQTLNSAAILTLALDDGRAARALYHGGCTFRLREKVDVLAAYTDGRPAIVRKDNVILSGVHFECTAEALLHYPAQNTDEQSRAVKLAAAFNDAFDWYGFLFEDEYST